MLIISKPDVMALLTLLGVGSETDMNCPLGVLQWKEFVVPKAMGHHKLVVGHGHSPTPMSHKCPHPPPGLQAKFKREHHCC